MDAFNAAMRALVGLLPGPLSKWHPLWGLGATALVTAVLALLVYRAVSNQAAIRRAKDRIRGHLLEVRLYRDEGAAVFRALLGMLANNAMYLLHSLLPVAFLLWPVVAILAQLNLWYGYGAPAPGDTVILKARFADALPSNSAPGLTLPAGLVLDAPPLVIPSENEVDWRLRGQKSGRFVVEVHAGGEGAAAYRKVVTFADSTAMLSPKATAEGAWQAFLFPGEAMLPKGGPIRLMEAVYRPATVRVFGRRMHWLIPFFVLTMIFAYALKGVFRVEL